MKAVPLQPGPPRGWHLEKEVQFFRRASEGGIAVTTRGLVSRLGREALWSAPLILTAPCPGPIIVPTTALQG